MKSYIIKFSEFLHNSLFTSLPLFNRPRRMKNLFVKTETFSQLTDGLFFDTRHVRTADVQFVRNFLLRHTLLIEKSVTFDKYDSLSLPKFILNRIVKFLFLNALFNPLRDFAAIRTEDIVKTDLISLSVGTDRFVDRNFRPFFL